MDERKRHKGKEDERRRGNPYSLFWNWSILFGGSIWRRRRERMKRKMRESKLGSIRECSF